MTDRDFVPGRLQSRRTYDPETNLRSYEVVVYQGEKESKLVFYATYSTAAQKRYRNACKQASSLAEFKSLLEAEPE